MQILRILLLRSVEMLSLRKPYKTGLVQVDNIPIMWKAKKETIRTSTSSTKSMSNTSVMMQNTLKGSQLESIAWARSLVNIYLLSTTWRGKWETLREGCSWFSFVFYKLSHFESALFAGICRFWSKWNWWEQGAGCTESDRKRLWTSN